MNNVSKKAKGYTVSYGTNIYTPDKFTQISLKDVIQKIKGNSFSNLINLIRNEKIEKKTKELKKKLPWFSLGRFKDRVTNDNLISIQAALFDADKLNEIQIKSLKVKLKEIPEIFFYFVSPSGKGLKFAVLLNNPIYNNPDYQKVYEQLRNQFSARLNITLDDTKDSRRICFLSYDPNVFYNPSSAPILIEKLIPTTESKTNTNVENKSSASKSKLPEWQIKKIEDCIKVSLFDVITRLKEKNAPDRHYTMRDFCASLATFGIPENVANQKAIELIDRICEIEKESGVDPDPYKKKDIEKLVSSAYDKFQSTKASNADFKPRLEFTSAKELQNEEIPPLKYAVQDFLPEGYCVLGSRPKIGKSWMALQVALSVAIGGTALGKFAAEQGVVLYIALEDNKRRMQSRINQLLSAEPENHREWPKELKIAYDINTLKNGGEYELRSSIEKFKPRLVVIDTLRKFSPLGNKDGYQEDYDSGTALHKLAKEYNICLLTIHHTTKAQHDYVLDELSGTTGVTAALDTALVLKQVSAMKELHINGRDILDESYKITFDKTTGIWTIDGTLEEARLHDETRKIIETVEASENAISPNFVANELKRNLSSVKRQMYRLAKKGLLSNHGGLFWGKAHDI